MQNILKECFYLVSNMLGISHYTRKEDLSETENNSFISEKNTTIQKFTQKLLFKWDIVFSSFKTSIKQKSGKISII